jgi:hypothetical protein
VIRMVWAAVLLALAGHAPAGVVVPCEVASQAVAARAEPATIDQLMKQLVDIRAQKAEIEKREKATLAELKQRLELLRDLLKDLDIEPAPAPQPAPKPKPDDVKPAPVTSFRVLFVVESAETLTAAQSSVIYGRAVSDYLTAKTTPEGGKPGWRRFEKDTEAADDTPTVKALWAAVRPQITAVPCVVIEVNGKATIEVLPATPEAAVKLFKSYAGDK